MKRDELARMIDHTLLKPEATPADVQRVCEEALRYHFASVCVNPVFVPQVAQSLRGSDVKVCTVVGFPLGATSTAAKVCETEIALAQGAQEIDMVLAVGLLKAGDLRAVEADIAAVAAVCRAHGALLKVILETALLTDEGKIGLPARRLCRCALRKDLDRLLPQRRDGCRHRPDAPHRRPAHRR